MSRRLSPIDIEHAEFPRSVGGYDRKEVRAFLERLSVEVEASLKEAQVLRQELDAAEERMSEAKVVEEELRRAVMAAERIANDVKEVARKEARLLLQDAELQKESKLKEANEELSRTRAHLSRLEHQRTLFKEQFRGLLQAYLAGLDAAPAPPQGEPPPGEPPDRTRATLDTEGEDAAPFTLLDDSVQP